VKIDFVMDFKLGGVFTINLDGKFVANTSSLKGKTVVPCLGLYYKGTKITVGPLAPKDLKNFKYN
jgi:hypothetical protein